MNQYVIYDNPSDYPGKFVVRRITVGRGSVLMSEHPLAVTETLLAARKSIPPGLHRVERFTADDPVICEVWL